MTLIDQTTSLEDLQVIILNEDALYRSLDEARFLSDGYSADELRETVVSWIEAGDECAAA
jgi:hypothetical protein